MAVRIATLGEQIDMCRAIERVSHRSRAGHALAALINREVDPNNFDQSLRGLLSDMTRAINDIKDERRKVMYPDQK